MVLPDRTCYEFVNFTPDLLKIAKITSLLPPLSLMFSDSAPPLILFQFLESYIIVLARRIHTCFQNFSI